ncbi:hypothetical protein GGTG_01545 [Gaeumannomyces tritici R3-111a-1]|uniref:Uncharacterized protein n=1 Tax=Gaeumannomyces tritici (strain R3-111a-1) TaxID=644352 RepID=J3NJW3_GAET3|nr:hypothetical protein GGTG_01545 [Gaeumannomyces tritici R3-111a-1]EJT81567.1 hypothetical protein GGTG_01545 [Gaeumannomyces tritici R3-111a-1]
MGYVLACKQAAKGVGGPISLGQACVLELAADRRVFSDVVVPDVRGPASQIDKALVADPGPCASLEDMYLCR